MVCDGRLYDLDFLTEEINDGKGKDEDEGDDDENEEWNVNNIYEGTSCQVKNEGKKLLITANTIKF